MGFFVPHKERGFLLAEIVAIAGIIAVLSTFVIVNISSAHKKSRDTERKSNIETLQVAFRTYKDTYSTSTFPSTPEGEVVGDGTGDIDTLLEPFLEETLGDPLGSGEYQFYFDSSYNCNGIEDKAVLLALTMEREGFGNYDSTCSEPPSSLDTSGVTPSAQSYIVIVGNAS